MPEYQKIPVPGFTLGETFAPDELMYSANGFTQKGITIAGGQGVIESGTIMARNTSDKKYYPYDGAGADDLDVPHGVLRRGVDMGGAGSGDQLANIVIMGIMRNSMIKGVDAAAITALGAVVDETRDTFKL